MLNDVNAEGWPTNNCNRAQDASHGGDRRTDSHCSYCESTNGHRAERSLCGALDQAFTNLLHVIRGAS
jgi:hypothetical protein